MIRRILLVGLLIIITGVVIIFVGKNFQKSVRQTTTQAPVLNDNHPDRSPSELPEFLTEDQKKLLEPLPKDKTSADYRQKYNSLVKAATSGTNIDIKSCIGTPLVLKINSKQKVTISFKNLDNINHRIYLDDKWMTLPAQKTLKVVSQKNKVGIYGYKCDNYTMFTGFVYVADK